MRGMGEAVRARNEFEIQVSGLGHAVLGTAAAFILGPVVNDRSDKE